ncbi:hypothetical protein Tco_0235453, partial [Tanacetum coccineum]
GLESVQYGVSNVMDTAYWGFLGVGTTFDIFQNILGVGTTFDQVSFVVFGECRHRYAVSSLMDTAYWLSEQ